MTISGKFADKSSTRVDKPNFNADFVSGVNLLQNIRNVGLTVNLPLKIKTIKNTIGKNDEMIDEKQLKFIDESMLATMGSILSNEEADEKSSQIDENENNDSIKEKTKEKSKKRYTSYSDFHFMEEMK